MKEKKISESLAPAEEKTFEESIPPKPEAAKKPSKKSRLPAIAFIVILLIAAAVLSAMAFYKLFPQQPENNTPIAPEKPAIKAIMIYSDECKICQEKSVIILGFDNAEINYSLESFEAGSETGKQLVQDYNLSTVPALLLEEQGMRISQPDLAADIAKKFEAVNGYFVLPEIDILKETGEALKETGMPPVMFLQNPDSTCNAQQGKVKLDAFIDLTSRASAESIETLDNIRVVLDQNLDFNYRNLAIGGLDAVNLGVAAECAKVQDSQDAFIHCSYNRRFVKNANTSDLNEMKYCATIAIVYSLEDFTQCVKDAATLGTVDPVYGEDGRSAQAFELNWVPSFVVDCKYVQVGVENLFANICALHPELEQCIEAAKSADNNASTTQV